MKYICGNCKSYDPDTLFCSQHPEWGELVEEETCDNWNEDVEPTKEEKREIVGDIEAHRRMVEE